ncbi:hypothetical protein ABEB36_000310 [Hypothenemus hampei]|uniref:Uncharacterized protein n=1 Tax=Hypothenemus hampei TaxID=57062 RepID=A0ABD1FAT7_HYPHA
MVVPLILHLSVYYSMALNKNLTDSLCEETPQDNVVIIDVDTQVITPQTLESLAPHLSIIQEDVIIECVDENSQLIINPIDNSDAISHDINELPSTSNENYAPNFIIVEKTTILPNSIVVRDFDSIPCGSSTDISLSPNQNTTANEISRKKKGRKRKFVSQNRNIEKQKANNNEEYINSKGVLISPKDFAGEKFN